MPKNSKKEKKEVAVKTEANSNGSKGKKEEPEKPVPAKKEEEEDSSPEEPVKKKAVKKEQKKPASKKEQKKETKKSKKEEVMKDVSDGEESSDESGTKKRKRDEKSKKTSEKKPKGEKKAKESGEEDSDTEKPKAKGSSGPGGTVFVANLSFDTTNEALSQHFKDAGVPVTSSRIISDRRTSKSKGYGYVEVENTEVALTLDGSELEGRAIKVDVANSKKSEASGENPAPPKTLGNSSTVFVGNLPVEATELSIKEKLEEFGVVTEVRLIYERDTDTPRGFGYCEFADPESAQKAVKMTNQVEIDGKMVKLDFAAIKSINQPGGRGGSRGGRGGGRRG